MNRSPFLLYGVYFLTGILWILFSDWLIMLTFDHADASTITLVQNIKGFVYIVLTTLLLYILVQFANRKLLESQERYLKVFMDNPDAMLIYDPPTLEITEVNEAAIKLYGFSRNEFIARRIKDIFNFEGANLREGSLTGPWIQRNRDGEVLHTLVSEHKIETGKKEVCLVLIKDYTRQKGFEDQLIELNRTLGEMVDKRTEELNQSNKKLAITNQRLTLSNKRLSFANEKIREQADIIRRQNEETLNRILSSLKDVVWSVDLRTKSYIYLSPSVEDITGKPYEEFRNDINLWKFLIHPDDRHLVEKRQKSVFSKGYHETTFRMMKPDGAVLWIYDKVNLVRDDAGGPLRMEGIASDITTLRAVQDEIVRFADRLNLILESIADSFFTVNRDFCITRVNRNFERLAGRGRDRLLDTVIWDVFSPADYPDLYRMIKDAMIMRTAGEYEGFFTGFHVWLEFKAYPYLEGLSVFIRDITKEKKTQQQILYSKKNLDALINNTSDLIWSIDQDFRMLSANKAFCEQIKILFGVEPETGQRIADPDSDDQLQRSWVNYYRRALSGEYFTITNEVADEESKKYFDVSFNPIYNDEGETIGVGCFARNVTERKNFEEERNQLIKGLIAQTKSLEEFGYVTSHKMRAPVANILGLINILNKDSIKDEENLQIIQYLESAGKNLDETIHDLTYVLDMQRLGHEVKEEVNLEEAVKQVKRALKPALKETGAIVNYNFLKVKTIYAIKSYIHNILLNMISNSLTYRSPDRKPVITIKSFMEREHVCFTVEDNGLGIDLDRYKDQLFQLYKRFHSHTVGRGVGLYLVKSQVEAMGGAIEVESRINHGAIFKVSLKG